MAHVEIRGELPVSVSKRFVKSDLLVLGTLSLSDLLLIPPYRSIKFINPSLSLVLCRYTSPEEEEKQATKVDSVFVPTNVSIWSCLL